MTAMVAGVGGTDIVRCDRESVGLRDLAEPDGARTLTLRKYECSVHDRRAVRRRAPFTPRVVQMLDQKRVAARRSMDRVDALCPKITKPVTLEQQIDQLTVRRPAARAFCGTTGDCEN